MPKQTIEIDIPEGLEFVRVGKAENGEHYIDNDGTVQLWHPHNCSSSNYIIVRPIERWRVPTKLDLLNRDSIQCRVRDRDEQNWKLADLVAISSNKFITTFYSTWQYCEIRDTEPKPRECWGFTVDGTLSGQIHATRESAIEITKCGRAKAVRFIEVPE